MDIVILTGDYKGKICEVLIHCTWGENEYNTLFLVHLPTYNDLKHSAGMWGWNDEDNKILYQKPGWNFSADIKDRLYRSPSSKYRLFDRDRVQILDSNRSAVVALKQD